MGDIGVSSHQDINSIKSSIIVFDRTWRLQEEISVGENFPEMIDIQGITYDLSDRTLWFCDFGGNEIYHIDRKRNLICEIKVNHQFGITYDSKRDKLWVMTYSEIKCYSKTGHQELSFNFNKKGQDQLFYDEQSDRLYASVEYRYYMGGGY